MKGRVTAVGIAVACMAIVVGRVSAQESTDSVTLRPTTVTVTIENDRHYSGEYTAQGVSRVCGNWTLGYPHRVNAFTVEFPDDETGLRVRSVQFDADTLRAGTNTSSFYLAVGIRVGERGAPPLHVVRANKPEFNEPGTATLVNEARGVMRLTVSGTAALGVRVRMTVVCQPRR